MNNSNLLNTINLLQSHFPFEPTDDQNELIKIIAQYFIYKDSNAIMLIKGYAGTGKTTSVVALVNAFKMANCKSVLLAPTGRAAKVLSSYSKKQASTIHRKIYYTDTGDGFFNFTLQKNKHKNTFFIVDEASMISNNANNVGTNISNKQQLLDDLISYVFNDENCRLIFIGDSAQLPPIGLDIGQALDTKYLKTRYNCEIFEHELKKVVRQAKTSGILHNATLLRLQIEKKSANLPFFQNKSFPDFNKINGETLEDELNSTFLTNLENSILITRSNKRANLYNEEIRKRILYKEERISAGDLIMVVKNNYYWLTKKSKASFIANGDIVEILNITNIQEIYGFTFADARIRLIDYPEELDFDVKILLDTLDYESPNLPFEQQKILYSRISEDYTHIPSHYLRHQKVMKDPFLNALQIKFAYAITCHKAQGGQWDNVFIDQGYIPVDGINTDYLKWLYTAITRSSKNVYLINFNEKFFE